MNSITLDVLRFKLIFTFLYLFTFGTLFVKGAPVLHVWNIHVEKGFRRRGLGRHLLVLLELLYNPGPVHADVNGYMFVGSMALPQSCPAAFIEAVGQRMSSLVTGAKAGRVVASSEVSRSKVTSDVEMGDGSK
jgi:hypothetical protein